MIKIYNIPFQHKDLRDLDKEQFEGAYKYIKEITNNFTKIDTKFLRKNPQYLLIIRNSLGLSQLEFSKLLGTTNKAWVRHFEAGRQGFKHSKMFPRALQLVNKLFSENKIVNYERALLSWQKTRVARRKFFFDPGEPKYKIKKISKMSIDDFKNYLNYLKKETKNFINFDSEILVNTPQFISIFRIILNLGHRPFAKKFNENARTVRTHEYKEYKLMPETAKKYMDVIERLFIQRNMVNDVSLKESISNFKRISFYDGLEKDVEKILNKNKINFEKHYNFEFNNKNLNVDFVIFKDNKPIITIEVTKLSLVSKHSSRVRTTHRITYIDHRFQILKLLFSNIKTIMIIKCPKNREELVRRVIKREIINTDFYFINEDLRNLKNILKKFV